MIIAGLDTETTGLPDPQHRIIELHIQKWEFDPTLAAPPRPLADKTWRIHPDRSIDPKALAVHHITLDDLAGCPQLEAVTPEIVTFMTGIDLMVAHNADFDSNFMRLEFERVAPAQLPWLDRFKWFDTMTEGRWATPWGKAPSLQESCFACDVPYDPSKAHAASYDVACMMKVFFFGHRHGFYKL